jgi:putative Mg2+ transporter-C (MgtC) family protein
MDAAPTFSEIIWRIVAATLAGALVGMERESRGRAAGLRTTILTCLASALAMITSEYLFSGAAAATAGGNWRPDPARLGAGILTGIGFLGAGTILRHEDTIRGVTTAACLWLVTVLGLAFGAGLFLVGGIGLAIAFMTLILLPDVEKFIASDWFATLTVTLELDSAFEEHQLKERMQALGFQVRRVELIYDMVARRKIFSCELKLKRRHLLALSSKVISELRQCPGVLEIKWE